MEYRCGQCRKTKDEREFFPSQRKTGAWCRDCHRDRYGKKVPNPSRPCQWCETVMVDPNPRAKFCSRDCKNDAKVAARRDEWLALSATRTCDICSRSLEGRRTDTRYCSETCAAKRPTRKATARRALLKGKYGLTEAQFDALLRKQRYSCAICKATETTNNRAWHVDHDHETGKTRGLLCNRCNVGLGQFRDDPDLMIRAARYVRRSRKSAAPDPSG